MRRAKDAASEVVARYDVTAGQAEFLVAELHSLGTLGIEERPVGDGQRILLLAYFPAAHPALGELSAVLEAQAGVRWLGLEHVPQADWDRVWRRGLEPRRIGRLWIRPSWCESQGGPELVIDPNQAFGSGEHATTRLALRLLLEELRPGDRVLDLGAGSGILALGASRLGASLTIGIDRDPIACATARVNARANGLPLPLACGTLHCVAASARFDVCVANMLLQHLEPSLKGLVARTDRVLLLSGYLSEQRRQLDALCRDLGAATEREEAEVQSGDRWCARVIHVQTLSRQSSKISESV